jgi:hypothetical protein
MKETRGVSRAFQVAHQSGSDTCTQEARASDRIWRSEYQYASEEMTSPPFLLPRAHQAVLLMLFLMK